jgi:phosphoribosylanthranilate isomerase
MVRTKVCGITREADLEAATAAGADAVGVIAEVSVDTPREVSVDRAAELVAAAPPTVSTFLVTMAPTTGRIAELVGAVDPDAVQVHAGLSPERVVRLRSELPADVVAVADAADPGEARRYDGVADAVLVDSVSEGGGGGTGRTHDWERTAAVVRELTSPVILAGGLTPDNVARAVRTAEPFAVDVASGVEREGGIKDHDAVRAFVANARSAGPRSDRTPSGEGDDGDRGREVEP